jgi:hypothetical protein
MTNLPCNLFQDLIYFIALLPDQTLIELFKFTIIASSGSQQFKYIKMGWTSEYLLLCSWGNDIKI